MNRESDILGPLLFLIRITLCIIFLLLGLFLTGLIYPWIRQSRRDVITRWWSRGLVRICGVRLRIEGQPIINDAVMWAANHVSWIDIFLLNSIRTTNFIAKKEIRDWPVIGALVAWVGTVFIDRSNRQAIKQVSIEINRFFEHKLCVGLFPEGTTSEGFGVLPLYASLLEVPLQLRVPLQPVCLKFTHKGKRSGKQAFVGEQNLLQNLWLLLSATGVGVTVQFLEPIIGLPDGMRRADLAAAIRYRLEQELYVEGLSPEMHPPEREEWRI